MNSLPDDPKVTDALQRVLRGETAEFEVVLRRYERSLRAWLAAHVPMGVDVDEILASVSRTLRADVSDAASGGLRSE